jgi:hypothetical protein
MSDLTIDFIGSMLRRAYGIQIGQALVCKKRVDKKAIKKPRRTAVLFFP